MTALYFHELNLDPKNPTWEDRDRFVLSKGHVCPVLYTCLGLKGYFPQDVLGTLRKEGSILQGHPDMKRCPGVDISTGSLGQGLSVATGMALVASVTAKTTAASSWWAMGKPKKVKSTGGCHDRQQVSPEQFGGFVDDNGLQNDNTAEVVMPHGDIAKNLKPLALKPTH